MDYRLSKDVVFERDIEEVWIFRVMKSPTLKQEISYNETVFYGMITERENRCLKVVTNPLNRVIVTAYFDRNMRKRGCQ